jgi:hypothetical protein
MAHKVILPQKKNYIPQFLKQRDINSYSCRLNSFSYRSQYAMSPFLSLSLSMSSLCGACTVYMVLSVLNIKIHIGPT